jgi:aminoglycoside phosphotransferase (APT) family kinase protein
MHAADLAALAAACTTAWGSAARVTDASLLTGGASAETWRFDGEAGDQRYPCILRRSPLQEEARFGVSLSKQQEASCLEAVAPFGVPVPPVHFRLPSGLGDGYVMARCEGETLARRLLCNEAFARARLSLPAHCAQALGRLHAVPDSSIPDIPLLDAANQLRELDTLYRSFDLPSAVFEVAFRWLTAHLPPPGVTAWVHGDFRMGNLLVDPGGLVAVLDWELSHRGDPVEDLGWFCVRSWRFGMPGEAGGLCSRDAWREAYARATGVVVDPARLHFWELFGTLKWGVICLFQVYQFLTVRPTSLELAAIGRRVSEVEHDLLLLLEGA